MTLFGESWYPRAIGLKYFYNKFAKIVSYKLSVIE